MIIFINGAFGAGKTTVAEALQKQLPNSIIYDPEEVGMMLRNILQPIDTRDDFQDYATWPGLVVQVAKEIKQTYDKDLIISMTIWREDYFLIVENGLKELDDYFYHFCLTAPEDVLKKRLMAREKYDWAINMAHKCAEALQPDVFKTHIDTTQNSPQEIVDYIIQEIG